MKNKSMTVILIIFLLIFVSGCIGSKIEASCGNNIVETGEECDGDGCPAGEVCKVCQCVSPQEIPSPPALPA